MKELYFCIGCRQVHHDEDYNPDEGDLLIHDLDKLIESAISWKVKLTKKGLKADIEKLRLKAIEELRKVLEVK